MQLEKSLVSKLWKIQGDAIKWFFFIKLIFAEMYCKTNDKKLLIIFKAFKY